MTGKRRFLSYMAAVVAMMTVEIVVGYGAKDPVGMSVNFMQALVGVSTIHFTGLAVDKFKNGGK